MNSDSRKFRVHFTYSLSRTWFWLSLKFSHPDRSEDKEFWKAYWSQPILKLVCSPILKKRAHLLSPHSFFEVGIVLHCLTYDREVLCTLLIISVVSKLPGFNAWQTHTCWSLIKPWPASGEAWLVELWYVTVSYLLNRDCTGIWICYRSLGANWLDWGRALWLNEWKNLLGVGGCVGPSFFCTGGSSELSGSPDTEVLKLLAQSICPGWPITSVTLPPKALWGRSIGV